MVKVVKARRKFVLVTAHWGRIRCIDVGYYKILPMAMATCFGTAVVHNKQGLRPNYLFSKRCSKRSWSVGKGP
ncbi:hypothetical protein ERO13_A10G146600v2 [Gossypium hirsutum]|uniref:Uncharacterized protein n=1 Tax=Gossypium darwinii TaxID=34276 RepID=A0A5D2F0G6_GOSDA|nr:hypothetical protein ERO13_A10G146600v2 [Gossypium hirsutum]TYG99195.1 hypothetical protein ES288_A10G176600v1 [Gossypium darwinii]